MEAAAARAIGAKLDELDAGALDLGLSSGACGGDLLFAEACRERGVAHEMRLPFAEARFLATSVAFAGAAWVARFAEAKRYAGKRFRVATRELGEAPEGEDPFARTNLWMLRSALARGAERLELIALWNRRAGDGPGGTGQMVEAVGRRPGRVHVIDTNLLLEEMLG